MVGGFGENCAASAARTAARDGGVEEEHGDHADEDDGEGAQRGAFELLKGDGAVNVEVASAPKLEGAGAASR